MFYKLFSDKYYRKIIEIFRLNSLYYINIFLYLSALIIFIYAFDYGMPIEVNPDEIAQLKNIYGMINAKSLALQYPSSYSVWTHYIYNAHPFILG